MLAVTHHVMVLTAARRCGLNDFTEYAILGDDVVIANYAVAMAYEQIARDLGVDINMDKSLFSHLGVLEFAKRLFSDGVD